MTNLGGDGPYCITVLWTLTGIVLVFLLLRIYTRVVCLAAYGLDDTLYVVTTVLTVAYSSLATVACLKGYGRSDLDAAATADTTFWRMVAQTFSLLATGTSKASVGAFLLRIVAAQWHKVVIWVVVGVLGVLSLLGALFTFLGCRPISYSWDDRLDGSCINTVPLSMLLALGTIVADLIFVVLSWIFIWKLNSPRRDKIILALSLSLGLFAAAAGAFRIMAVKGVRDVPVPVIVWSQVETSVTLICVGIPVCLPLWTIMWRRFRGDSAGSNDLSPDNSFPGGVNSKNSGDIGLRTIGGTPLRPSEGSGSPSKPTTMRTRRSDRSSDEVILTEPDASWRDGPDSRGND